MKTTTGISAALLAFTALAATPVNADDMFFPHWYGNIHLADANTSLNQASQEFTYLNVGASFGYQFTEILGAEFFMSFATNGERDEFVSALLGDEVETEFDAVGLYMTAQTPGEYYVKARAGVVESRFIYSAQGYEDASGNDVGFSYGVGGGTKFNNVRVELEYVVMPEVSDPLFSNTSYDTEMLLISVGSDF